MKPQLTVPEQAIMQATRWIGVLSLCCLGGADLEGAEPTAAQCGRKALLEKVYSPPTTSLAAYETVWIQWGLDHKPAPADYARLFRERYGLHPAPYPNHGYPMGLRAGPGLLGFGKALAADCLLCHGGSIAGQSYIGLGNASLDFQAYDEEMAAADGRPIKTPFTFCNVRGTSEAAAVAVFLLSYRQPDLSLRPTRLDLDLHDDLCEDVPAWWLLKKKKTMYYTGGADTRSVRSLMQFMLSPLNPPAAFESAEADFADIRAFLLSLEPPQYPLSIDRELAGRGEALFKENCSRCHGTYGEKWTYPNKIIPLKEIGTDRRRFDGITAKFGLYYNQSWFAQGKTPVTPAGYQALPARGYQAPPLDGLWATAPYLHNGSVPTVYHVLNSKARPRVFTRSYRTGLEDYDPKHLGWKVQVLEQAPRGKLTPLEARKIYDTSRPGRGNGGHTFGDHLDDPERFAIIEYLKTL
jgi:mono/diheme cytochrome c family protein